MRTLKLAFAAMVIASIPSAPGESQMTAAPSFLTYADIADLAVPAPVAAHVRISRAVRLKDAKAGNVPAGKTRFYVEADTISLIRGVGALPPKVSYLVDLANDAKGRPVKIGRKSEYLLLASTVGGRPGELRLAAADAQLPWSPALGDRVRGILAEAARPDAAPQITGIGRAFNVPGTLPGESETQIFLQTADARPVSLSVLRRPGEQPLWSVALSEIVDDAATAPRRDSLLWYRLACALPATLPNQSLTGTDAAQSSAIRADYRFVLAQLGPCARNRVAG